MSKDLDELFEAAEKEDVQLSGETESNDSVEKPSGESTDESGNESEESKVVPDKTEQVKEKEEDEKEEDEKEEDDEQSLELYSSLGLTSDEKFEITSETSIEDIFDKFKEIYESKQADLSVEDEEVKDFIDFKKTGGTLEEFKEAPKRLDYSNVVSKLDANDDNSITIAEQIVRRDLTEKGLKDNVINTVIGDLKDDGSLIEEAKGYVTRLDESNKQQYEAWRQSVTEQLEDDKKKVEQDIKEIKTIINEKKSFGGVVLSKNEVKDFEEFVLKADKNSGITKSEETYRKLTLEQTLLLDYILFKNFDLKAIAKIDKVKTENTKLRVGNLTSKSSAKTNSQKTVVDDKTEMDEFTSHLLGT